MLCYFVIQTKTHWHFCGAEWLGDQQGISEDLWWEKNPYIRDEENGFWRECNGYFNNAAIDRLCKARTRPRALLLHRSSSQEPRRFHDFVRWSHFPNLFKCFRFFIFKITVSSHPRRTWVQFQWFLFLVWILFFRGIMSRIWIRVSQKTYTHTEIVRQIQIRSTPTYLKLDCKVLIAFLELLICWKIVM